MKTVAVYSIKGGVGKTTTAVNIAHLAAADGRRTLVWDLDPQGAASFFFRVQPKVKGGGKGLVRGKRPMADAIKGTDFPRLDLLPADLSYRHLDLVLDAARHGRRRLHDLLAPLAADYDLVVLDCPPGITLLSEAVFRAADVLLVPVIPATLAARTLTQLEAFLAGEPAAAPAVLPFFSMVDPARALHADLLLHLPREHPGMLRAMVPASAEIERMGVHRMPLPAYCPADDPVLRAYRALWHELALKLDRAD